MEPAVVTATIAAAAAVIGPPVTWALTKRRETAATVELTEAQADQIRQQIYDRLVERLEGEIARLTTRVAELERDLARLDLTLRQRTEELARVTADRDRLRLQLAATQAEIAAKEREVGDLRAQLAVAAPRPA